MLGWFLVFFSQIRVWTKYEDFLIISGEWHDGLHCPTQDGEPGGIPENVE